MSGLVCRLHVLLFHVDEYEWTCVQTPHIQRGTWASHVLMITSLAIRWANVREDSIENRCHHHHHHHHCRLVSGYIYSSLFRLVQSGTGIWCWKPVTIGQYLALQVYIGVRNAHMLEWQPHIHRLINFLPFCVQKANVSQFVENFKKSRLMLVHGTGDGECLSCVWTVLPTEQLVCGHENGLAVHSQATPLKNNLGIYIYL